MYRTILVGTDGSETARIAVERACDVAEAFNARLLIVSAFHLGSPAVIQEQKDKLPDEHQWQASRQYAVREALARAQEVVGPRNIDYDTRAVEGNPAESLLDVADEAHADLIVVGNKGMSGVGRFLMGSVPNKVSHHANCDVTIVRTTP